MNAKSGTQISMLPLALKTGKCELRVDSFVTRILTDEKGRPCGVQYFDADKNGHEQYADLIVVACSATESAPLIAQFGRQISPTRAGEFIRPGGQKSE